MSYFLIYLIKSTVFLGLFYAFFLVAMRSTTFFRFNRAMLLLGTFVCMLLPCYSITVNEVEGIQLPMQILDEMLVLKTTDEPIETSAIELTLQEAAPMASSPFFPIVLLGIYLLGMLVYLAIVIRSFAEVWKMIASHPKQWKDGCWLVIIPKKIPSFSWSNYIVISEEDYRKYPQVLVHERMHYLCRHSYDILFFTIVHALHWFNPLVWLIRTELKLLHEFEADQGVINQGIDATQYQILLVKKAVGQKLYTIANGFNHTKLQKRITMMIKEKTNSWERLKWLVTVPVVMGAMLVFAQPEVKGTLEEIVPTVDQQDAKAEISTLKSFFDERLKASEKKLPDGTVKVREKTVHLLFLNAQNEVSHIKSNKKTLVDIPLEGSYQTAIANLLREARAKDKQESRKDEPHTIYIRHHKEASDESVLHLLKEAKAAFDILRSEYKEQGITDIESVCPYRLYMEDINGIDVTILDEESGKALLSVKDIKHVNQLKEALDKLPREKRKIAHVNLKADKDTSMEEITAIKQVLREYHILQLNMEVNKTIVKNGQGTLYQQQTITKKKK
jgi:hypothetical protein